VAQGSVRVLQTVEHQCGYFRDRKARNLVIDPLADHLDVVFNAVVVSGFRRAGDLIFRPHCEACQACEATRVPVSRFTPNRRQRRCQQRNADLDFQIGKARCTDENFELYSRYVNAKHHGGGMDQPEKPDFENFLLCDWSQTFLLEMRLQGQLLAVSVTDRLSSGLSAVYTFWDPDHAQRGLGICAILEQIEMARRESLPYVYLGYWIKDHAKMHYKVGFQPIELFRDGGWVRYGQPPDGQPT
jgi:arginine-tRNA-protein transferase